MSKTQTSSAKFNGIPWFATAGAIAALLVLGNPARAHEDGHDDDGSRVTISVDGGERCIVANGLPDHDTGAFPNQGNPNAISEQDVTLCVPADPVKQSRSTEVRGSIGVALNGVQIRPGTAEYYDGSSPRGFSRDRSSGWNYEGLGNAEMLGMDNNVAHVDQSGLYHYHGVGDGLVENGDGTLIGYAADGFEIHYVGVEQTSSYRLKSGTRPSGPGGTYDGTFVQDWEYVAGSGTLDACNGGTLDGKFVYFATDTYPFFPRCLWGEVSDDFQQGPPRGVAQGSAGQGGPAGTPPGFSQRQRIARLQGGFGPPPEAVDACVGSSPGSDCSFTSPRGDAITGNCGVTPNGASACLPQGGPPRR